MKRREEVVGFLRGTRPRAPPGRRRPAATFLLIVASIAHLPLVYLLVKDVELQPPFTVAVGLVAMGLAWSGGVSLEGRRQGTVRIICALGLAEGALAFVPVLADSLGSARWLFAAIGLLSLGALVAVVRE